MAKNGSGGAGKINAAAHATSGPQGPQPPKTRSSAAKGTESEVGNETKANMKGALMGQPTESNSLRGAVGELNKQHPYSYADHGPHHGTSDHVRHEPLHGLRGKR